MQEAKTLSQLEHPMICRVYDFVEGEDSDFLIMELVRGSNLTASLAKLSHSEKLAVALQIAEAISVAHQQNIVHRDLKPDNVMLTKTGSVKVLDFGLATSFADDPMTADSDSQVETSEKEEVVIDFGGGKLKTIKPPVRMATGGYRTENGLIMGTPMFMSPEQARGEPTTGASDMYSFGLLLQWLFTEKMPYPPRVPVILRAMEGDTLPVENVDYDLTLLINRLKSMNQENRPTAMDTLDRIRWIRDRPKRRIKRFASLAFVVLLVLGTTLSTIGFMNATQERHRAEKEKTRALESEALAAEQVENAKQTVTLLQEFLSSVNPQNRGKELKVIELLEAFRPRLEKLGDKPEIQASLYYTYSQTYRGLGLYDESYTYAEKSLELRKTALGEEHSDTLESLNNLALVLCRQGKDAEAEQLYRQCLEVHKRVLGDGHPETMSTLNNFALALAVQGKYAEAEPIFRECLETGKRVLGDEHRYTSTSLSNLACVLENLGKYNEAEQFHRQCLEVRRRALGEDHPDTLDSLNNLSCAMYRQRALAEAEELQRQCLKVRKLVLGHQHPDTLDSLDNLGLVLLDRGKDDEAEQIFRQYHKVMKQTLGLEHPATLMLLNRLAFILSKQDKPAEAERHYRQCLEVQKRILGEDHPDTLESLNSLARNLVDQNAHLNEAENLARQCVQASLRVWGEEHRPIAGNMHVLAIVLEKRGKLEEAIEWYRKAARGGNSESQEALKRLGEAW